MGYRGYFLAKGNFVGKGEFNVDLQIISTLYVVIINTLFPCAEYSLSNKEAAV